MQEQATEFAGFGGTIRVRAGHEDAALVERLLAEARDVALDVHTRLTRFEASSELCRLNDDPRTTIPSSPVMRRFADAVQLAGRLSGGLVDATVLDAVVAAGYADHWSPGATMAAPRPCQWSAGRWSTVGVEEQAVVRPVGVRLDSGGLGKGLAADLMAEVLAPCRSWLVDCGGDLSLGGTAGLARPIEVRDPHDDERVLARLRLRHGGVATSGSTRRAWAGGHHLIDPRTGRPAELDLVQVTAIGPTALVAEIRAKSALLAGSDGANEHLPDGGYVVPRSDVSFVTIVRARCPS